MSVATLLYLGTIDSFCLITRMPSYSTKITAIVFLRKECSMLNWAVIFFIIALVAAVLGFGGIAGSAIGIAKVLFLVFLVLAAVSFILGRRVSV